MLRVTPGITTTQRTLNTLAKAIPLVVRAREKARISNHE
jgi:hypothetical protein